MKTPGRAFILLAACCSCVGWRATSAPFAAISGEPTLFAPHLWAAGEEVHGGTFSPDASSFYFFKKVGPSEDYRIVVSHWTGGAWSAPQPVSFSTTTSDLYPAISRDGQRIVFTSYRRMPGDTTARANASLWMVERVGNDWGTPRPLSAISSTGDYHPGVQMTNDGTIYFRVISRSGRATYRSRFVNGTYTTRERVIEFDRLQNDTTRVWGAEPSPDESRFFLGVAPISREPVRVGAADIYVARRNGDRWETPTRLPASVNTPANESPATITPDNRTLIFSRDGRFYQVALASLGFD